jgi:hypothetical protein
MLFFSEEEVNSNLENPAILIPCRFRGVGRGPGFDTAGELC